jgi:septal ring-binding cell division protein DamX
MGSSRKRGSAGERVLEGRHVIGLFMLMLLFSGLFFTLGYVMGRDGQVRAADVRGFAPPEVPPKPAATPPSRTKPAVAEPASDTEAPANSDWEFYHAGDSGKADDRLKPVASEAPISNSGRTGSSSKQPTPVRSSPAFPLGGLHLQVAALTRESDAMALARNLQRKNFPTFVQPPATDKYYHVLVGPYPDQKAAENARKGLELAGFKAIVKH